LGIGIVTDGKYGNDAYENISKVFPCEWIEVEELPTSMIFDDYELDIPDCDMYIAYLRHPDQVFALAELGKPALLGISFGDGFMDQIQEINPKVIKFPTMCSVEQNTGIPEIDDYAKQFGRPIFESNYFEGKVIDSKVLRCSPCGSSAAGADFIKDKEITPEILQDFAIHVCYECRAPRFGKTCDKEIAGIIHLRAFLSIISDANTFSDEEIHAFMRNIEVEYNERLKSY